MERMRAGTWGTGQALPLLLTIRGVMGPMGWQGISSKLEPDTRGPLAYLLGLRMIQIGKLAEALMLLHTARDDAPPNAPLATLVKGALDHLLPPAK